MIPQLISTGLAFAGVALALRPAGGSGAPEHVDFARHVRPVLAERCLGCHGPDERAREGGLRLDTRAGLFEQLEGHAPVVPGDLDASELWQRVTDPLDPMPPLASEERLSPEELELLRSWIEAGAPWEPHWSFVPPVRPAPPAVADEGWVRDPIDRFVRARQEELGLEPTAAAPRQELLRRVSFDLTGLPPTLAELDAFLADARPDAYERVVDRLLASPRYGERQAQDWLDLARYADSNGDGFDVKRDMWRWREWVVEAFNEGLPFDEFTVAQLAGDLLPEATREQRLATGFQRNHTLFTKGGAAQDEYRHAYVVDRVNTMSTVWMGLTLGCAQCHDHKYDPVSQREYYGLYDAFNDVSERDVGRTSRPTPPFVHVPEPEATERLARIDARSAELERVLAGEHVEWDAAQAVWEAEQRAELGAAVQWETLEPYGWLSLGGARLERLDDGSFVATGPNPGEDTYQLMARPDRRRITGVRLEVLPDERFERAGSGRSQHGRFQLTDLRVFVGTIAQGSGGDEVRFARGEDDVAHGRFTDADKAVDALDDSGWMLVGDEVGEAHSAVFVPAEAIELNENAVLRIELEHEFRRLYHQNLGRFRLSISDDERLLRRRLPVLPSTWHAVGPFVAEDAEAAWAQAFGPEAALGKALDLKRAKYEAPKIESSKEGLRWKEQADWRDGVSFELGEDQGGEHAAWYLHRRLDADRAREVRLRFSGVRGLRAWLDGELVHDRALLAAEADADYLAAFEDYGDVDYDDELSVERYLRTLPRYESFALSLGPGEHQLVLKLVTGEKGADVRMRIDPTGAGVLSYAVERALLEPSLVELGQPAIVREWFRRHACAESAGLHDELERLALERRQLEAAAPTVMVLDDACPRETRVLTRGAWNQPGAVVDFGVPAVLPPLDPDLPRNRLGLARWLVADGHPLTSRVAVNRLWQQLFGRGLVTTPADFGTRGELPSHAELLDWLARELVENGWDVKAIQRRIVLSSTYRQSARVSAAVRAADPGNRWLARGPRQRLSAEMIRDNALSVSRLLGNELGGRSVKPYQPAGLWENVGGEFARKYEPDKGKQLYRRGLYVFWKRGVLYPSLATFDAPARTTCATERSETNTPLQALVLLNDPVFVEAARELAVRMLTDGGAERGARLMLGFRACTSRMPNERELAVLLRLVDEELAAFADDAAAAEALLGVGDFERPSELDPRELAAWTLVAGALLNLDATIHRS